MNPGFGLLNQNLPMNTRVEIGRTTDPHLDGQRGTIIGKSFDDPSCTFYIVLLDDEHAVTGARGIILIESCIKKLSNH